MRLDLNNLGIYFEHKTDNSRHQGCWWGWRDYSYSFSSFLSPVSDLLELTGHVGVWFLYQCLIPNSSPFNLHFFTFPILNSDLTIIVSDLFRRGEFVWYSKFTPPRLTPPSTQRLSTLRVLCARLDWRTISYFSQKWTCKGFCPGQSHEIQLKHITCTILYLLYLLSCHF